MTSDNYYALSGSWDWDGKNTEKGLFLYRVNKDGTFTLLDHILADVKVGSTPVQGPNDLFYIVEERSNLEGRKAGGGGYLYTIRFHRNQEKLEVLQKVMTLAATPSFCALSPDNRYIAVSHHTSTRNSATKLIRREDGTIDHVIEHDDAAMVLFSLSEDGTIKAPVDFDTTEDENGTVSLLHSAYFIPGTDILLSGDKGLSRVHAWRVKDNRLHRLSSVFTQKNSACRYIAIDTEKNVFHVNNEQKPLLYTFSYTQEGIKLICTSPVLEEGYDKPAMASDLVLSRDGKYLYNILRVIDRIAVYRIQEDGTPLFLHTVDGHGAHNRGCAISFDDTKLYAANMESDCIAVFDRDKETGELTYSFSVEQSRASNLLFFQ